MEGIDHGYGDPVTAIDGVITGASDDHITIGSSVDGVVARVAEDDINAKTTPHRVISISGVDEIIF